MATAAPVSMEYYLANPTEPESEYFEGELIQKAFGTFPHARLQAIVGFVLHPTGIGQTAISLSVLVRPNVVLIPDVCVLQPGQFEDGIVNPPAILCVEILSPSDRFSYTAKKCKEYLNWGVQACWIFDPETKEAWVATNAGIVQVPEGGTLEAGAISLPLADIFPK